jgi:hypothetical protein
MTHSHYIREYESSLSVDACESIIQRFEDDEKNQARILLPQHRSFTEINITPLSHWRDVHDMIINKTEETVFLYRNDIQLNPRHWPEEYGFEQIRIKRYQSQNQDEFRNHVDVGDHSSARRFLVCFWYLNTVVAGGETVFTLENTKVVKPIQGSVLVFPPLWVFPHAGRRPLQGNKYIIGTYLHYL